MDLFEKNQVEVINLALAQIRDMENDTKICKTLLEKQKDAIYGHVLSEKDFYPPEDNKTLCSVIEDIDENNSFAQFTHDFFELCDEEEIYD